MAHQDVVNQVNILKNMYLAKDKKYSNELTLRHTFGKSIVGLTTISTGFK